MSGDLLTLEEIQERAAGQGLELSERTFRYYAVLGLLPRPVKDAEDARVHRYPLETVARLLEIRDLQAQGYTLKQIKAFHQVAPVRAERGQPSSRARRAGRALDTAALLHFFAADVSRDAARRFLRSTEADDGDAAVREAALRYYREQLRGLLGEAEGDAALDDALAGLSPLQIDALIQPLRRWREAERRQSGGQPALVRALRVLARAGRRPSRSDADTLRRTIVRLRDLEQRVDALPPAPPTVRRAREGVAQGLAGLRRGAEMLAAGDEAARAEIDRASQRLEAAVALLEALRRLLLPD